MSIGMNVYLYVLFLTAVIYVTGRIDARNAKRASDLKKVRHG